MFNIYNQKLADLIKNSIALRKRLMPEQIKKFSERAMLLPPEGQEDLIEKLEQEAQDYNKYQKKLMATARKIDDFDQNLKLELDSFKKQTYRNAEEYQSETDQISEDDLMQSLEDI